MREKSLFKRIVFGMMMTLLLISLLMSAFNIHPIGVEGEAGSNQDSLNGSWPSTEWNRTYGGTYYDHGRSVVQTTDGGYAIAGGTQSYGAGTPSYPNVYLVKTDASGTMVWNKTYGGTDLDSGYSVVQTSDGGYAIVGVTQSYGVGTPSFSNVYLVKTDASGTMVWNKTYGGTDLDEGWSVVQTSDGGYAMAGYTKSYGVGPLSYGNAYFVKTFADGTMAWNKTYGGTDYDLASSVVQTGDGGYVLAGSTKSYGAGSVDVWLVKTDSSGNIQWNKTYGGTGGDYGWSVVQTSDGGYAIAGQTSSFIAGGMDFYLVKTNSAGSTQWNKTYGGTNNEQAWSVVQASDGGYAIAGWTDSYGVGTPTYKNMYFVRTLADGTMAWNKTYGGGYDEWGYSLDATSDGGYAIAGGTYSFGVGTPTYTNAWLVKLTPQTIYIRADGSIDPPTAPIVRDGNIYTLTDNIYSSAPTAIVIEKNGITLDGAGYTIQGSSGIGIDLTGRTDVTIKNLIIQSFSTGIRLSYSLSNYIQGNTITNNQIGIWVFGSSSNSISGNFITKSQNSSIVLYDNSSHNTLTGNTITDNYHGVWLWWSPNNLLSGNSIVGNNGTGVWFADGSKDNTLIGSNITDNHSYGIKLEHCLENLVYHNNFVGNSPAQVSILDSVNIWDDGYPSGGNYWSDYAGVDLYSGPSQDVIGNDGIGDTRYVINVNNQDNYPLMELWTPTRMLPPPTEWNKTYGGPNEEEAYSVIQTRDGGYAIAGYTWSFGAGGSDFWLIKTDASGEAQWNKTYGGTGGEWAYSLVQTSDEGYALAGVTTSYGAGDNDFWLVKTDSAGTMQWSQTYGGTNFDLAYSLVQTSDGGYALAGYTLSFGAGYYDFWLVKTDSNGNMMWNKTYGGTTSDEAYSVIQTRDGGYAIAGETSSFGAGGSDFWLIKTDASGEVQWDKTYGGTDFDVAYSMIQTRDEGYAIAGSTNSYGAHPPIYDFWLIKTDASGEVQWDKTYGGTDYDEAYSVVQTSDGGYALTGYTESFGAGSWDMWLVKTDATGAAQWNKTCGEAGGEYAISVLQTRDGGYALAGAAESSPFNFWLVKVAGPTSPSTEYPWPMFHHNPRHTGSTESPAPATNQTQWTYTIGAVYYSSPAIADGRVYIGSVDRNVYCLDASTGAKIWNYTTGSEVDSSPAVDGDRVYVGSYDGKVYCLSALTGEHLWNYTTGAEVVSSPVVIDGKVYFGSADRNVYCLNAFNGVKIWNYTTGNYVDSSPAVADSRVYIGSWDRNVYCLDALTGRKIWNYTTGGVVPSSPAAAEGRIYVASYDRNIYCLDALTGAKIWNRTTGWAGWSSPAVTADRVYVGDYDHRIYCLDAFTGAKIWNYTTDSNVSSSPAVAGGKIYVGSDDNKVYCLDASTGTKIWSYTTGSDVVSSPAIADGMVFIGSFDGNVYAFGNIVRAEDYPTLQAAVDAAPQKATVIIPPGEYRESIVINKPLTIMGKKGSSTDFEGGGTGIAIKITSTYDVTVTNVVITNWNKGILIENSAQCKIYSNIMYCMVGSGIALAGSGAVSNHIYSNSIYSNNIAINITTASTSNMIHDNTISLNSIGINIESNGNTVYANTISQNNIGIKALHSSSNIIYWNNFVNNIQTHIEPAHSSYWDDGFPAGGNYWSDYKDRYPSAHEFGTSGIWNTPYEIDGFNVDNYPLMYPAQEINVTKVTPFKTIVGQGYNIRINVTITNRGKYTEIIKVTLHASTTHSTQLTNIIMPSRTSKNITITWNTMGVLYGTYPISAEVDPVPGETDTTNNMRSDGLIKVTIAGDINGDGRVDILDLYAVGSAHGSSSSTSNWNPHCDINDDDIINSSDLLEVSKNYGKMI